MRMFRITGELPEGWVMTPRGEDGGKAHFESPDGRVDLAYYTLLPGIVMTDIDLSCSTLPVYQPGASFLATINWCSTGRCEVDFGTRGSLVVGSQTLCLSSSLAESFSYPTASYRGFEYFIDFDQFDDDTRSTLEPFGLTEENLRKVLVPHELGVTLSPEGSLLDAVHSLESELAHDQPRSAWLLLYTCKLFMLLAELDLGGLQVTSGYLQRSQRDIAQEVYQQIMADVAPSVDLRALSVRLGVSEASLRSYFSRVYGQSPAAFARSHALSSAARMLAETSLPVADISQACGYANPSKFSAAFRRAYDVNPLEYRRRSRLA
ncbi:MAG: helix-turn-helix transcriptional regulator [Atopobiaceae bacterium]|nr:helix-turn-helix transcriptional regulator [Atopobiaceae bacterium]